MVHVEGRTKTGRPQHRLRSAHRGVGTESGPPPGRRPSEYDWPVRLSVREAAMGRKRYLALTCTERMRRAPEGLPTSLHRSRTSAPAGVEPGPARGGRQLAAAR